MTPDSVPALSEDVIWRVLDDGAVLVSPEVGKVRAFNEVGTAVWELIDGERSVAEIEERLVRQYEVAPERLREDLYRFLSMLADRGLLVWKSPQAS